MRVSRPGKATRSPTVAARCARRNEEILEAAIRLFAKHGYADADLQVLADELGVGKGTLYRHFGSKQELFLAAADRVMQMLFKHIDAASEGIEDPLDRIERAIVWRAVGLAFLISALASATFIAASALVDWLDRVTA